tara:strand:+ start:103 stop:411 length:309 start_codon:yes stop_codon:yes gene_type:complete
MFKQLIYILLLLFFITTSVVYADDFDGGIPIDSAGINDNLDLGINIQYIKRNAIAKARRGAKGATTNCGGAGNQTFGPGADLKGATIVNLSDNKGTSAVCIK